ncbi:MAG: leucine--tRNA ligase [Minisyncoccia bacterium]
MAKYDHKKTEKFWQKKWLEEKIYEPAFAKASARQSPISDKTKFYNLMMFPYPSAEGLHVGNMYAFTGSDIYGRFRRMRGYDVFEPIGLDGFGIHSENYAIKTGKHPADQVKISQKNFYKQLSAIGNGYAWDEKVETYDPEYYKWTQWLFVQMFKHGLAYRKKQPVNWCPSCKTVLADEQVVSGECERCGTKVIKKELEQWFFKITDYAERLLKNLDKIDWSEKIKTAQRNWMGKSEGVSIKFQISNDKFQIEVFTTRPDTLFGATYLVLAPEHEFVKNHESRIMNYEEVRKYVESAKKKTEEERIVGDREKTGVELKGIKAVNPATGKEIPIWIADYVLSGYGTGAIMAVPAHDERDFEFAKKFHLPIIKVIEPEAFITPARSILDIAAGAKMEIKIESDVWIGDGKLINSGKYSGMDSEKAGGEIAKEFGKPEVKFRLRDWLISRQRYWGPPIPMIFCDKDGWQPVPESDLPVLLPKIENFRPTGTDKSPLAQDEEFVNTKCPKCDGPAKRETDVSDTFLDSSWYYLRYPSAKNGKIAFDTEITKKWCPVDMYIGGAEHAVLHLLYIRFVAMALNDWKMVDFEEPITKFRAHGLLIKDGAKMSKSHGNVVNPDEMIELYGADALRMYLMFLGPFEQGGDYRDEGMAGITRFLAKVWKLTENIVAGSGENFELEKTIGKSIKKITEDVENLGYNTAISQLMILLRGLENGQPTQKQLETFVKLLAPFAPHISEEIWRNKFGYKTSIHVESWPTYNPKLITEEIVDFVIQVNGKTREMIKMPAGAVEEEVKESALADPKVQKYLESQSIKKVIFVKDRLINFVL